MLDRHVMLPANVSSNPSQRSGAATCMNPAGTAVEEARATLQAMLLYILQCRKTLADIKVAVPGFSIDAIVVERMAAVCAMALGAVMSGMGDLKTFKVLRCAVPSLPMYVASA